MIYYTIQFRIGLFVGILVAFLFSLGRAFNILQEHFERASCLVLTSFRADIRHKPFADREHREIYI